MYATHNDVSMFTSKHALSRLGAQCCRLHHGSQAGTNCSVVSLTGTCLHRRTVHQATSCICRHAGELRARLDEASQAKAWLQTALEALLKHSRAEDAAAVEEAMQTAQDCDAALEEDIAAAQQALQRWQRTTNNEAKLAKVLKEGASVAGLSRAIQVGSSMLGTVKHIHTW